MFIDPIIFPTSWYARIQVDNSSFTGESEAVELSLTKTDEEAIHSRNLAFNGATCVEGRGVAIVVRVGDDTMIGTIARLASIDKTGRSTLEIEVLRFVRFITWLAIGMAATFYVIAVVRGGDPLTMFIMW